MKSRKNESETMRRERKDERQQTRERATEWQKSIPFGGDKIRAVECKCYIMNSRWAITAIQVITLAWMCNEKYPSRPTFSRTSGAVDSWQARTASRRVDIGSDR